MDESGFEVAHHALLAPARTYSRDEVLDRPSAVPASPGVYGWYFDQVPPGVPVDGCKVARDGVLLYVGISPKAPGRDGFSESRQSLRSRIRYHYQGNAEGSTLRLTLGSLLAELLGIELRLVGSGRRLTFSGGEEVFSQWMSRHARVCWFETSEPWHLEAELIRSIKLPLNLDQNLDSQFRPELSAIRAAQRARARSLPILPR